MDLIVQEFDADATLKSNWQNFYSTNVTYLWMCVVFNSTALILQYWWITKLILILDPDGFNNQEQLNENGEDEEFYYDNSFDGVG